MCDSMLFQRREVGLASLNCKLTTARYLTRTLWNPMKECFLNVRSVVLALVENAAVFADGVCLKWVRRAVWLNSRSG